MSSDTRNFMYAMLNAVGTDQSTMQWMEISDSIATTNDAHIEESYYTAWDAVLKSDASKISTDVKSHATQGTIAVDQSNYQKDSTTAQSDESTCDGASQAAQQAVGQDGSNLQNKAQLASTLSTISQSMASMLSHAYS